jgi:hypothetical protein
VFITLGPEDKETFEMELSGFLREYGKDSYSAPIVIVMNCASFSCYVFLLLDLCNRDLHRPKI